MSLRRICASIAVALLVVACTRGVDPTDGPSSPAAPSGAGVISEDSGDTRFVPGRFVYRFNSITAQATFEGSVATMSITNDTGSELGVPSLYVIGADDRRYDGATESAAPIASGEQASLEFMFPEAVKPQTIGLAILSFGDLNVGAMAPVPVSGL
ncbi:MAG: hypothetical protein WEE66_06905 [Actinomycetota bacterium]